MRLIGVAFRHRIIFLPVGIHSMGPSLAQAEEGFHGVVAVAGFSAVGEGFVDGSSNAWGPSTELGGSTFFLKVDPLYSN
jgi:hypothetical protein